MTPSPLTKIGIYTQLLQEEKIFPMMPYKFTVVGLLEPEICRKMLKNLSEKPRAKFPATTLNCSMVKIGHLDNSSQNLF